MKKYASTLLVLAATLNLCIAQPKLLPKPSGDFFVGVDYLCFTDTTRKELFDNNSEGYRELTVKTWYPTDAEPANTTPYFYDADIIVKYFAFPEIYSEIISNSSRATPLSNKENRYPVVIFNHGWGEHFAQNTILMEELASKGYVVFSIAHHYESKFSFYPDGKFISIDMNSNRFKQIMQEQQQPGARDLIYKMMGLDGIDEQRQILIDQSNALPTLLKESPINWANDISFFLDQLEMINIKNQLMKGKLDLKRIGVMGMSMGGMATNEICISDSRVQAGINMDGGLTGSQLDKRIQTPFMFLNGKRYVGYGKLFTKNIVKDGYSFSVRDADHYNFTDYSIYKIQNLSFLMGTIEGNRIIVIMNDLVVAFFDKYLKQKENIDIINKAQNYPEIEIWTNM
jgi:predicted dienelactone hydrolase